MSRPHVVVVNDDPVQLRQVAVILEKAGHEVSTFTDAADALAGLSGRLDVHLFVVDLHMPGIDGWKLCRLLRSPDFGRYNETPILVVSATFTGSDVTSITRDLGANGFLEAPFDADSLRRHVDALLVGEVPRVDQVALIVEDDAAVRSTLVRTFEAHGYEVVQTETAAEARAVLARRHVDVALLDYHLPDGTCDGLLVEGRGPTNRTSMLVMTGDTDPSLPVRLMARGADAYLRKPFDPTFAVELARNAARQRSLLRIESILEARTHELQSSETRYRELFLTIPDLVLVIDARWHVAQVNPEGLTLLGAAEGELVGRHILELAHPESSHAFGRWISTVESEDVGSGLETELIHREGERRAVELTGRRIEWHGAPALLLVGRDLTERRKAEAERRRLEVQMQHAQRLESLGVLAGGVAHDFNNLLVGILGNASLAMMDLDEGSPVREPLQQIELAGRRAAELTQQILAFAGKSKVASQEVDLTELVHEMGQLLEPAVSKKARLSLPPAPDPAAGPWGRRTAASGRDESHHQRLGCPGGPHRGHPRLRLAHRARAGGQVGRRGRGTARARWLGLSSRSRIRLRHGRRDARAHLRAVLHHEVLRTGAGPGVHARDRPGAPRLHPRHLESRRGHDDDRAPAAAPLRGEHCQEPAKARGSCAAWQGTGTVLVVDDEPQVRSLARLVLPAQRLHGGRSAERRRRGGRGLRGVPDAVVMDVSMPEMDGVEALGVLRSRYPWLPVVLSSGYPPEGIVEQDPASHRLPQEALRPRRAPGGAVRDILTSARQLARSEAVGRAGDREAVARCAVLRGPRFQGGS